VGLVLSSTRIADFDISRERSSMCAVASTALRAAVVASPKAGQVARLIYCCAQPRFVGARHVNRQVNRGGETTLTAACLPLPLTADRAGLLRAWRA
jgi:hypothetical protein